MGQTHVERNAAGLTHLHALAARLSEDDLQRQLDDDWTIAMLLAHLAFWDYFVLARWEQAARNGLRVPSSLDDAVQDLINAAALPVWRACVPGEALPLALAAAKAVNACIADLDEDVVADVLASGRLPLVDRALHRDEHLAAIAATLDRSRTAADPAR
jgi:hypothetical protein